MKTKRVRILIKYNLHNALPAEVLEHEIPVLRVLHGEGNITFLEDITVLPDEVTPRAEFLRLKQEYHTRRDSEGSNPVDAAYPDGARDVEIVLRDGLAAFDRLTSGGEVDLIAEDDAEGEEEELLVAEDLDNSPKVLDRAEVIAKLQLLNIPFSLNTPTQHLAAKLPAEEL